MGQAEAWAVHTSATSMWPMLTAQCSAVHIVCALRAVVDAPWSSIARTRSTSPRNAAVVSSSSERMAPDISRRAVAVR
jgi:hypothetical protein